MRAFWAIEIPDAARLALAEAARGLAQAAREFRLTRADALHVTLAFLGEVDERHVPRLTESVSAELLERAPFPLRFGGAGWFPPRGAPRIAWIGVTEGAEPCIDLAHRVAAGSSLAGYPGDSKPFHPHVTVARARGGRGPSLLAAAQAWSDAVGPAPLTDPLQVARVSLFESVLGPGGSTYTLRATAALSRLDS